VELKFRFWFSDRYGLIRQRSKPGALFHPEVWRRGRWEVGSPYVMEAITGMGGDSWSCGDMADEWDEENAAAWAKQAGIDLFADNRADPHEDKAPVRKKSAKKKRPARKHG
jgi:hypothetical protein